MVSTRRPASALLSHLAVAYLTYTIDNHWLDYIEQSDHPSILLSPEVTRKSQNSNQRRGGILNIKSKPLIASERRN